MANSCPQFNDSIYGEYIHTLTVDDLPKMDHSMYISNNFLHGHAIQSPRPVGHLTIAHGYTVSVYTKPSAKHLSNMLETFGWTWEDV